MFIRYFISVYHLDMKTPAVKSADYGSTTGNGGIHEQFSYCHRLLYESLHRCLLNARDYH